MVEVKKEGILLKKTTLGFENEGVLNPAVISHDGIIHLFYRAVSKGNYSSVGHCVLSDPLTVEYRFDVPVIFSQFDYEVHGVEDPRIVRIEDTFYLTYAAYDGVNALGAYATSNDLITWQKRGLMVPEFTYNEFNRLAGSRTPLNEKYQRFNEHEKVVEKNGRKVMLWDKNVVFFPRKIDGKFFFLHRIKPDIQVASIENLEELNAEYWQNYFIHFAENIVITPKYLHEVSYVGGGCPPIETQLGWLVIYHGVYDTVRGYVYTACAALLDLKNPHKEVARLPYPLFEPQEDWELKGEVNNVCFPTGSVVVDDELYIYYGAADEQIAVASVSLSSLLKELMLHIIINPT
jgi:predicted GH43/DUF377 family glycosyl hydrolase